MTYQMKNLLIACATTVALAGLSTVATGQDALGRGDALDANTQVGSGGRNAPVQREDFRLRNLIVTGDVAGGRGFRGSVGYTAAGDFRDSLGSDDLFQFRAESAFSSPNYIQMGLSNDRLRFGQDLGIAEFHRSFSAAEPNIGSRRIDSDMIDTRRRLDLIGQDAFSGAMLDASMQPMPLGVLAQSPEEMYVAYASPLRGLQLTPWQRDLSRLGFSTYDIARLRDDIEEGRDLSRLGRPFEGRFGELAWTESERDVLPEGMIEPGRQETRISDGPFENILREIARRNMQGPDDAQPEPGESQLQSLDERFAELRRELAGEADLPERRRVDDPLRGLRGPDADDERRDDEPPATGGDRPMDPMERGGRFDRPGDRDAPGRDPMGIGDDERSAPFIPDEPDADDLTTPHIRAFAELLRHGRRVEDLGSEERDRFNELINEAQSSLRTGEYLQAERRFNRALRLVPNQPMATAGLVHAQIGAGLYAVAGLNLRQMFVRHPEMIDTRYDPSLLPAREQIDKAMEIVGQRMDRANERPHQALLLAYIGRQTDDADVMQRGLNAMQEGDALTVLVREVWTGSSKTDVLRAPGEGRAPVPPAQSDPEK